MAAVPLASTKSAASGDAAVPDRWIAARISGVNSPTP